MSQNCDKEINRHAARNTLATILSPLVYDQSPEGEMRRRWANRVIYELWGDGWVICQRKRK